MGAVANRKGYAPLMSMSYGEVEDRQLDMIPWLDGT